MDQGPGDRAPTKDILHVIDYGTNAVVVFLATWTVLCHAVVLVGETFSIAYYGAPFCLLLAFVFCGWYGPRRDHGALDDASEKVSDVGLLVAAGIVAVAFTGNYLLFWLSASLFLLWSWYRTVRAPDFLPTIQPRRAWAEPVLLALLACLALLVTLSAHRPDPGLLAAFGRKTFDDDDDLKVTTEESDAAMLAATSCGDAMVRAVKKVVNPTLVKRDVPGDLRIGIGIECGRMIITKIGLLDAYDVTAYGHCVNRAAKISSENGNIDKVIIGRDAELVFPWKEGGRIKVSRSEMHLVEYPADANTLK